MNNFVLGFMLGFLTLTKEGKEIQQQAYDVGTKMFEEYKKLNNKSADDASKQAGEQQ